MYMSTPLGRDPSHALHAHTAEEDAPQHERGHHHAERVEVRRHLDPHRRVPEEGEEEEQAVRRGASRERGVSRQ